MSRTTRVMNCSSQDVFDVLTDGWSYATWVVGAARIRAVDKDFPAAGSKVHHSVGVWPVLLSDETEVEEVDVPHEILLKVRAWPTGEGRVRITCIPQGNATEVVMEEWAASGPAALVPDLAQDAMLKFRNAEALQRLKYLAESRARQTQNKGDSGAAAKTRHQGQ